MVRTRIAPSPTGENLHIGNVYTALLNFAWAKKNNGKFIVRIEDTDRQRLVEGSEEKILSSLKWVGLEMDEGPGKDGPHKPYRQSERLDIYKEKALELVEKGNAFYCFCTPERLEEMRKNQQENKLPTIYDGFCKKYTLEEAREKIKTEKYVIRLNTPDSGVTEFEDVIRGKISFENNLIDDQVLLKSDGFPTYHLAVVIDDHLMEITHVIRAEEWITSTPKHVLLYNFFGWELPVFAHTPILRNTDKSKLSKRKNPVWISWFKEQGFLPEVILNFLSLMGWSHPDQKEKFDLKEFISLFDLKDVKAVGPVFDIEKLEWLNGVWIRSLSLTDLKNRLLDFYKNDDEVANVLTTDLADQIVNAAKSRMKTLANFKNLISKTPIRNKTKEEKEIAKKLEDHLSKLGSNWEDENLLTAIKEFSKTENVPFKIIFFLLTGKEQGIGILELNQIYGKEFIINNLKS